jgi:hypothetical protein
LNDAKVRQFHYWAFVLFSALGLEHGIFSEELYAADALVKDWQLLFGYGCALLDCVPGFTIQLEFNGTKPFRLRRPPLGIIGPDPPPRSKSVSPTE